MAASLLKSPKLLSVFLLFLIMLLSWGVYVTLPISKTSPPFIKHLVIVPCAHTTICVTASCSKFFCSSQQGWSTCHSFRFPWSHFVLRRYAKSIIWQEFFFIDYYKVCSPGLDLVICLYIKISESLVDLFSRTNSRLYIKHMFICLSSILAQFPMDHLLLQVGSGLKKTFCSFLPYALLLVFLFPSPYVEVLSSSILKMVVSILRGWLPRYLFLWWDFCYRVRFRQFFSFSWNTLL